MTKNPVVTQTNPCLAFRLASASAMRGEPGAWIDDCRLGQPPASAAPLTCRRHLRELLLERLDLFEQVAHLLDAGKDLLRREPKTLEVLGEHGIRELVPR